MKPTAIPTTSTARTAATKQLLMRITWITSTTGIATHRTAITTTSTRARQPNGLRKSGGHFPISPVSQPVVDVPGYERQQPPAGTMKPAPADLPAQRIRYRL